MGRLDANANVDAKIASLEKKPLNPTTPEMASVAISIVIAVLGIFERSYAVAGLFSFISLATGLGIFFHLRNRDLAAARVAITTGVLFFIVLFAVGEYLFALYFPG